MITLNRGKYLLPSVPTSAPNVCTKCVCACGEQTALCCLPCKTTDGPPAGLPHSFLYDRGPTLTFFEPPSDVPNAAAVDASAANGLPAACMCSRLQLQSRPPVIAPTVKIDDCGTSPPSDVERSSLYDIPPATGWPIASQTNMLPNLIPLLSPPSWHSVPAVCRATKLHTCTRCVLPLCLCSICR